MKKLKSKHWEIYGGAVNATTEEFRDSLMTFWELGQKSCPSIGEFITKEISLPSDLSGNLWQPLSWNIETAEVSGEIVAEARAVKTPQGLGGYQIRKPRLRVKEGIVEISGIHFIRNGYFESGILGFSKARGISNQETTPLLSVNTILFQRKSVLETLQIIIDSLRSSSLPTCRYPTVFQSSVMPVMEKNNCYYCHGGGPLNLEGKKEATQKFSADGNLEKFCQNTLLRSQTGDFSEIPLIALPLRGALNHPWVIAHPEEVFPAWTDWIESERATQLNLKEEITL